MSERKTDQQIIALLELAIAQIKKEQYAFALSRVSDSHNALRKILAERLGV